MSDNPSVAAEVLAISANAYASFAANRLLEESPEIHGQFGDAAFENWRAHFQQQITELSVALNEQTPKLFAARVEWSRRAFLARQIPEDVLKSSIACLRDVLQEHLSGENSASALDYIETGLQNFDQPLHHDEGLSKRSPLALEYLALALKGNSRGAIQLVLDAAKGGPSIEEIYQDVLLAAQDEVGRLWHSAEVSVAEEHYVSATTLRAMAVLCHQAERKIPNGLSVVAAAVAMNTHDIGLRAVSDLFELEGWNAICLGGDVPSSQVAQAVRIFQAPLVLLSATLTTHIAAVRDAICQVRADHNCKIIIGGTAFRDVPDHWQNLGADAYAVDAADALRQGARLVQP